MCNNVEAISLENDCSPTPESKPTKMSKAAKRRVSKKKNAVLASDGIMILLYYIVTNEILIILRYPAMFNTVVSISKNADKLYLYWKCDMQFLSSSPTY